MWNGHSKCHSKIWPCLPYLQWYNISYAQPISSKPSFKLTWEYPVFHDHLEFSLVYLFMCMYISYKAHNRCTQETFLKESDLDVNMFSALKSIPSVTMKSIWEVVFWTVTNCDSHKLRQFRNPAVAICDLSQFVIKAVTAQPESNNTENVS